jgi:uncharacterized protein (DUF608 family)
MRSFRGEALAQIAFPLGGIGTGSVSLSGRGALVDFEWWNHPGKGYTLPATFFAVAVRPPGGRGPVRARVLAAPPSPPYDVGGFGLRREQGQGLPHFRRAVFRGEYPFATVRLSDPQFPVAVELEGWNPLIPLDPDESGLPLAVLRYRLRNRTSRRLEACVLGSLFNAVGLDGQEVPFRRRHGSLGGNRNAYVRSSGKLAGLHLTRDGSEESGSRAGSMFLGVVDPNDPSVQTRWPRGAWFDDLQLFWDGLVSRGRLSGEIDETPSPPGTSDPGSIGDTVLLPAGASRDVVFLLAWYFPDFENRWNVAEPRVAGKPLRAWYGTRFESALAVAHHAAEHLPDLEQATRRFHSAFFSQTLPAEALDAASSQISTLRTPTCLRLDTGSFHAFEGCFDRSGCCPMDCTHVWNYAQALPHLWPSLERTLRVTGLQANLFEDGRQAFRSFLPLAEGARQDRKPAADGQMGEIIKLYRDWRIGGDTGWMKTLWPDAKRALEYAFVQWDADRDGVMEGEQHVTYDIELYGPNPFSGAIYLAALRAGAAMAEAVGDPESARRYASLAEKGAQRLEELCWNGTYYVQRIPPPHEIRTDPYRTDSLGASLEGVAPGEPPRYQIGEGCLSDQLLGDWMARCAGLGGVLPRRRVISALRSIFRHNFRRGFHEHPNAQRIYATADESGLLQCSWPQGGRPSLPFPYSDEVWTGVEYHVAAHLIWEGAGREGLDIVRAARDRYDGRKRNPWDEVECGHHYARAMSSWSLLHALSGFSWDGVEKRLAFAPRVQPTRFRGLFTAGTGWGTFEQARRGPRLVVTLRVLGGSFDVRCLGLEWPGARAPAHLQLWGGPEGTHLQRRGRALEIRLPAPVTLSEGESLELTTGPATRLSRKNKTRG